MLVLCEWTGCPGTQTSNKVSGSSDILQKDDLIEFVEVYKANEEYCEDIPTTELRSYFHMKFHKLNRPKHEQGSPQLFC